MNAWGVMADGFAQPYVKPSPKAAVFRKRI